MSKGLIPLIYLYRDARNQWPKHFIWDKPEQVAKIIKDSSVFKPEDMRAYILENYQTKLVAEKVEKELEKLNAN